MCLNLYDLLSCYIYFAFPFFLWRDTHDIVFFYYYYYYVIMILFILAFR